MLPVVYWVISNPNRLAALSDIVLQPGRKRLCIFIMTACVLFIRPKSPASKISLSRTFDVEFEKINLLKTTFRYYR